MYRLEEMDLHEEVSNRNNLPEEDISITGVNSALSTKDRSYFIDLCERCDNAEDARKILSLFDTISDDDVDLLAPTLPILAAHQWPILNDRIKEVVMKFINFTSSRLVRKAAIAALRCLVPVDSSKSWSEFFVLINALDEPQFHLVEPALTKFDLLLNDCLESATEDGVTVRWIQVLFMKAIIHSNGWVRLWAINKIITIRATFFEYDYSIIVTHLLPALNGNDVLWRLIDSGQLEKFIVDLGTFLEEVASNIVIYKRTSFYRSLLELFTCDWSPCSIYVVSNSLTYITKYPAFTEKDFYLFRQIMDKVTKIYYLQFRLCASLNLIRFFIRLTCWNESSIWVFPPFLHAIPVEAFNRVIKTALMEVFSDMSQTMLSYNDAKSLLRSFLVNSMQHVESVRSNALITWPLADAFGVRNALRIELCSAIVESLDSFSSTFESFDAMMFLWIEANDGQELPLNFVESVREHIGARIFAMEGTADEFRIFDALYKRLFAVGFGDGNNWIPLALQKIEEGINDAKHAVLLTFINAQLAAMKSIPIKFDECVGKYLKEHLKNEKLTCMNHDRDSIWETLVTNKLKLFLQFQQIPELSLEDLFHNCTSGLNSSSSWDCQLVQLDVISALLPRMDNVGKVIEAIRSCAVVVEECKNSRHYLAAIKILLNICINGRMLSMIGGNRNYTDVIERLKERAERNEEVAFAICEALDNVDEHLNEEWIALIVTLSCYVSASNKHNHVLHNAYKMAYSSPYAAFLSTSPAQHLHDIVHRIRLRSVLMLYRMCARNKALSKSVLMHFIQLCNRFDESACRSFALSLSHRQKTHLMQMILILVDTFADADVRSLCEHCIKLIIDSTQQPSIKLLVEFVLIRIYIANEQLFSSFINSQKELASERIGSITSWINVIMHIVKVKGTEEELIEQAFKLFVPWCTAQNFSVRCTAIAAIRCIWSATSCNLQNKWKFLPSVIYFDSEPLGNAKRIIDNLCNDFYFAHFHAQRHCTLQTIYTTFPSQTGLPSEDVIPLRLYDECKSGSCPVKILCDDDTFNEASSLAYSGAPKRPGKQMFVNFPDDQPEQFLDPLQRKIAVVKGEWKRPEGTSLIVIASLIDKMANIGGLCRTSEIFGAEKLVVDNAAIINNQNFKALSLSSENWITVEEVCKTELLIYLKSIRQLGYTIIAAEQTTNSVPFASFRFPPKSAILLGDEKEGVPVELIRYVDTTVEINQVGHTRSLNVHVTGALFIQKYAEQNNYTLAR